MKFYKQIILFLAFSLLFTQSGIALNLHFCKGILASVSIKSENIETCNKTLKTCCKKSKLHSKCCSNKKIDFKKQNFEQFLSKYQLNFQAILVVNYSILKFLKQQQFLNCTKYTICFTVKSNAPPLYKLFSQYIFYA